MTAFLLGVSCRVTAQSPSRSDLQRKLQGCQVPGVAEPVLCGHFEVPEMRGVDGSRRLALNIVVLPATTDSVASDPLVFLAGGGVVPATRYAGFLSRAFSTLRRHRDILLVDQRGTWNSQPLSCEPGNAHQCLESLRSRADLRGYSTAAAMDDLDAVRDWLGYPMLSLYGVSYGTKAAQVYFKRYPQRVRAAVLYGVVPLSAASQLDLAASSQQSLDRVFAMCAADAACQAAFPRLAAEFDSLLTRLGNAPGAGAPEPITDRMVRNVVQEMLGSARSIERLPLLIHLAYLGDYRAVAEAVFGGDGPPPPPPAPRGVFWSILCGESIPLIDASAIARATAGTFFGDAPVRSQLDACADWPRAELPVGFWELAQASVPVLAISGDLDPITPPRYGELVVGRLGNARHLVVPNRSHGDVDPCITGMFEQFLVAGGPAGLDTRCAALPAPLHFVTGPGSGAR